MDQRFGKEYKLCSKKAITQLFSDGKQLKKYPLRLLYLQTELSTQKSFQIVVSVPKRQFKRAVDRNKVKRLMREAVRKNKTILEDKWQDYPLKMALFLVYTSNKIIPYKKMEKEIQSLFQRLITIEE